MDKMNLDGLLTKAQTNLLQLATIIASIKPIETRSWKFTANQLQPGGELPEVVLDVSRWAGKGNRYLYVIRLLTEKVDLSKIEDVFITAKTKEDGRAYPRFNHQSRCLYVGGSRGMRQRLKDHLGYGSISTYGLHLAHWTNHLPFELEFMCAKLQAGYDPGVYQLIEDALWDEMSPMFGRKDAK